MNRHKSGIVPFLFMFWLRSAERKPERVARPISTLSLMGHETTMIPTNERKPVAGETLELSDGGGAWLDDADDDEVCAAPSGGGSRAEDTLIELPDSSRLNPSRTSRCFLPAFVLCWRWSMVDIIGFIIYLFHRQISWNSRDKI